MKTPLTKERLQNHITYSSWKYILLAVVAIFGWNLVYSVTAYQPPEEKKIILGLYTYADETDLNLYMESIRQELLPDMEEMNAQVIMPDEAYGAMILSTRIAARECDIYLLPRDSFQVYASQGAFMPLEEVLPGLIADLGAAGISLSRGNRSNDELGEKHQYGIPCADLPGIMPLLLADTRDMYLSVFFDTENNENVLTFFDRFVRDMMIDPATVAAPAQ